MAIDDGIDVKITKNTQMNLIFKSVLNKNKKKNNGQVLIRSGFFLSLKTNKWIEFATTFLLNFAQTKMLLTRMSVIWISVCLVSLGYTFWLALNAIYANLIPFEFGSLYVRITMGRSVVDHAEQLQDELRSIYVHLANFNSN